MRLIPGKTKVQIEIFSGMTVADIGIGLFFIILIMFALGSTLPGKFYIALGLFCLAILLLIRLDAGPNYMFILNMFSHIFGKRKFEKSISDEELVKKNEGKENLGASIFDEEEEEEQEKLRSNDIENIIGFTGIHDDLIDYNGEYYGAAIEIPAVEFRFFSETRKTNSIDIALGSILRSLPSEYSANIVKVERPILYDNHLDKEYDKLNALRSAFEKGLISEEELKSRVEILYDSINDLRNLCYNGKVIEPFYYLVLFDSDKQQLLNNIRFAMDALASGEMLPHRLSSKELAVFLKYTNEIDFDEREIDKISPKDYAKWAMPSSVVIKPKMVKVNSIITHNMQVISYPLVVGDAWMASLMSFPSSKVVVKVKPIENDKAVRRIDRSLSELKAKWGEVKTDSKRMEIEQHIESLEELLSMLHGANETLLQVNIYVSAYDFVATKAADPNLDINTYRRSIVNMKKVVKREYSERGMKLNGMLFNQSRGFIGGQINAYDPLEKMGRGISSNTVAAMYPWIFAHVSDPNGIKIGYSDNVPVFIDFFTRNNERVNSNMVIVGKTGSGKSYAAKSILTNLAADSTKIFVLDPENEYSELAGNLHGKFINVGNAQYGRLNPFHVMTSLADDESSNDEEFGSFSTHLQFLEEFFRQIMPECDTDALEYLNSIVERLYSDRGITSETNFSQLKAEDYPIFDDLYTEIVSEFQSSDNEYVKKMLRTLMTHVAKFSFEGRNANIWNGPSTVTTDENFTVFNFQNLLANQNSIIANGQMLLVLRYLNNEIIKNRDYNTKYGLNRKVVIVIDEAHVFIDEKFPIALDFMYQMAKRIRKYNGMQIVITQNIKDFVGSEEITHKSSAIINACQYSLIFGLAPNDMVDLCELYKNAGGINENEQEQIVSAKRGQAFAIISPQSRSSFKVTVPKPLAAKFEQSNFQSRYFLGEKGDKNWDDFLQDSKEKRSAVLAMEETEETDNKIITLQKQAVKFIEVNEAEFNEALRRSKYFNFGAAKESPKIEEIPVAEMPAAEEKVAETTVLKSNQEELIVQLIDKVSKLYTGISPEDIRRIVEEEVGRRVATEVRESLRAELEHEVAMMRNTVSLVPQSGKATSVQAPKAASKDEVLPSAPDGDLVFDILSTQDDTQSEDETTTNANGTAIGNIFDAARSEDKDTSTEGENDSDSSQDDSDDSSGEPIDVFALLQSVADDIKNTSAIDAMEKYEEEVTKIKLDDLVKYVRAH